MGAESKFISNKANVLSSVDFSKNIQIGTVVSVEDPESLGRIKVKIPGQSGMGGDDGLELKDIPWSYPMIPKFFTSTPKVGEGVFVLVFSQQKTHSDRLYFGPIISQLNNLNFESLSTSAVNSFTFATTTSNVDVNRIPELKGVFPNPNDISVQGRYNTDLIFKKDEILLRTGKFVTTTPSNQNPYNIKFNTETPGYIQIKNNIKLTQPSNANKNSGSVVNVVGSKINLLTHKDGSPRFNLANQDSQLSDEEILNILDNAHPLAFGDLQLEYLRLLKNAFLNHVHSSNGTSPTDLVVGAMTQDVANFKKNAENLENRMLSKNIRIN
jgi:hypothetical protein